MLWARDPSQLSISSIQVVQRAVGRWGFGTDVYATVGKTQCNKFFNWHDNKKDHAIWGKEIYFIRRQCLRTMISDYLWGKSSPCRFSCNHNLLNSPPSVMILSAAVKKDTVSNMATASSLSTIQSKSKNRALKLCSQCSHKNLKKDQ